MQRPLVILITGAPATGKTTLSKRLAHDLKLPLVAKDAFKETLFDTLGWSTVEWSQKLGNASYELMYMIIEQLLAAGVSQLVDCNFDPHHATKRWLDLKRRYPFDPLQIICCTQSNVLLQRYLARIDASERHPGHVDRLRLGEFDPEMLMKKSIQKHVAMVIGGDVVEVDTTEFLDVQYAELLRQVETWVHEFGE